MISIHVVIYWRGWDNPGWFFISYLGKYRHAAMAKVCAWMFAAGPVEVQWRRGDG